ncbi:MAG: DUF4912 domain-containing protein [Acetivibrionales bacterium]|jgi:hypothetical protein
MASSESFYQLPSGYNENHITLMPRDPNTLFAYWEICTGSKKSFIDSFGEQLWEKSVPVLKVLNISKNESFFIRINDFSNSWYINVSDSSCLYSAEVGRKFPNGLFVNLASSNLVSTPCSSVSSDTSVSFADYRDLKHSITNTKSYKNHEYSDYILHPDFICGSSSPGFSALDINESLFGMSSAGICGIEVLEDKETSSDAFYE